ncbi:guanine nucleotide exchange factor DBS isoform X2 [Scyliorhinus canicula]|uniref:guanine nucleotide exchange factor DBS isoform X2 n=1 Tax=Scyliorhinus canicula TaxID=7830 RepID=UPI0018F3D126|nr:guanine nucleotide exchange factor DBS isoform X2 [Scyliorhinus canicula]
MTYQYCDCDCCGSWTVPFNVVRISEGEMKSYFHFVQMCRHLEGKKQKNEIMQQEIRPLLAVDIIEQLQKQFAILSGGRSIDGAPIITFPEQTAFGDLSDEDFLSVVTYLTSIPSLDAASIGFIIIIDRRRDKWSSVKASLMRIAEAFPGNLQLVFILRPSRFIQRTIADIGIRLQRNDFKMKIIMLNTITDLHKYIEKSQLTRDLGGTLEYCNSQWIHHRTAIENFAMTVKTTAQLLQSFGTELAETELPNDVQSTKVLLTTHTEKRNDLKEKLKLAVKEGNTLLVCIKEPLTKNPNYILNSDELENNATVERLLIQLDETENAFDQFWSKHHLKLDQCLQLRHFEQDFREVKVILDCLIETEAAFTDIGDSVACVERLLKELQLQEEKAQGSLEKAQLLAVRGDQLIQSNHYAIDSIRPKCNELRRICDDFINEMKKKHGVLGKSLEVHKQLDSAKEWCETGIYLLASQAVDKCQSQEGAEAALQDIEKFLETAKDYKVTNPKEFFQQFDLFLTSEVKANIQTILQKLENVQEMFEKRQASLKKLAAKQTRPVQPVAPRPESSPKRSSPKPVRAPVLTPSRRSLDNISNLKPLTETELARKRNMKKPKGNLKIEVMHEASQGGSSHVQVTAESEENLSTRRRHIMNELIETERVYVEELLSIIEGYATEMDNQELTPLIPVALKNKKEVLFGNLSEIYDFHNRIFLKELENCMENPELVGKCFLKRKEDLQIYEKYCQNKPRSEALWRQCGDCQFFQECQRKLDHKLSLDAYLLKPVQRITKYQLLLKEMLKCSKNSEGTAELEEALETMISIIKSVNDSMHQIAITGFEGNLNDLGKLLMQGSFNVWTDHKKVHSKVKDLARFKPMQRHLFLYTKLLLFCKKREENADGHEKSPSYSFKHSLKMSAVGITENVKGDIKKFEIWYNGREEVYIIQASSVELKNLWVSEIRKVLTGQLQAYREASQLNQRIQEHVFQAPLNTPNRYIRKSSLQKQDNKCDSLSSDTVERQHENSSFNNRQRRADVPSSHNLDRSSLAKKRFTLQGLSNRRPQQKESQSKEPTVIRRISLASSISASRGSLSGPDVKAKRYEIKSDPTPLGFEDSLPDPFMIASKRNSTTSYVKRSISQTGWSCKPIPSLDTSEDFETIPSSMDELSNSDMDEEVSIKSAQSLFRVEGNYETKSSEELAVQNGEVVEVLQEGEEGQWKVRSLVTYKTGWIPSTLLQPVGSELKPDQTDNNSDFYSDMCTAAFADSEDKESSDMGSYTSGTRTES